MSLLLLAPDRNMQPWKEALLKIDPNIDVDIWPDVTEKNRVQFTVVWNQPKHLLNDFPNLKAISSLGAGVDHILRDNTMPKNIPVCRVVSPSLLQQMHEYILAAILNYQHHTLTYFQQKKQGKWEGHANKTATEFTIGMMGLGELGKPIALKLSRAGYRVMGWSASPKKLRGVQTFAGNDKLQDFLGHTTILVCLLPLTPETEGILDLDVFKSIKQPGYLINVARGEHLVEEDLIYALQKGWLEGACLDVFTEEPLPEKHPFWNRSSIIITPHVSSITQPNDVAEQIVDNYKRTLSGMELQHRVNRTKGY